MIFARFHAMILSTVARQKMYVMSYSKKIDNVIEDLELNLPIIHFEDINKDINIKLEEFVSVGEEKTQNIIEKSKEQEAAIKKFLN